MQRTITACSALTGWLIAGVSSVFFSQLSAEFPALSGRHVLPLFAHGLPPLLWQRPEPLPGIAHRLPLFGRQPTKAVESLSQPPLIIRPHLLPLLESLAGLITLVGIHVGPLSRTVSEPFLSFRRELIPLLIETLEHLLFILAELTPRNPRRL